MLTNPLFCSICSPPVDHFLDILFHFQVIQVFSHNPGNKAPLLCNSFILAPYLHHRSPHGSIHSTHPPSPRHIRHRESQLWILPLSTISNHHLQPQLHPQYNLLHHCLHDPLSQIRNHRHIHLKRRRHRRPLPRRHIRPKSIGPDFRVFPCRWDRPLGRAGGSPVPADVRRRV